MAFFPGDGLVDVSRLTIKLDLFIAGGKAWLNSFKVVDLHNYSLRWITGLSVLLNWLLKIIVDSVIQKERLAIIAALEKEGAKALEDIIRHYL